MSVAHYFDTMDYGPAPESDAEARAWLAKHDKGFRHFIGGEWVNGKTHFDTLEPATGKVHTRAPKDRTMEQRNREFAPKVLVVRLGSTVSFPNFDTVYHNVFSRSDARAFDLGIYKNGQTRDLTFDKEGIVRIGCNLHANMSGYIVVVNAPHYAITDDKGNFKFKSLAPGKYKLKAWSERTNQPTVKEITVEAADNTVKVALQGETGAVDKFGVSRGK